MATTAKSKSKAAKAPGVKSALKAVIKAVSAKLDGKVKKTASPAPTSSGKSAKPAVKSKGGLATRSVASAPALAPVKTKSAAAKRTGMKPPAPPVPVADNRPKMIARAKAALKKESVESAAVPATEAAAPKSSKTRKISVEINPNEAASALAQKWNTLYKKADQIDSKPYNMKAVFEEKTAIVHKVLGWGYILANRNDRLEVLFKDGIKYLISNYKP